MGCPQEWGQSRGHPPLWTVVGKTFFEFGRGLKIVLSLISNFFVEVEKVTHQILFSVSHNLERYFLIKFFVRCHKYFQHVTKTFLCFFVIFCNLAECGLDNLQCYVNTLNIYKGAFKTHTESCKLYKL